MPDSPPSGDEEHTSIVAVPDLGREDCGIKEQNQAQARVLDTNLDSERTTVALGNSSELTSEVSCCQCARIVQHNDKEYVEDVIQEYLEVL
jgi:hypothetical protein